MHKPPRANMEHQTECNAVPLAIRFGIIHATTWHNLTLTLTVLDQIKMRCAWPCPSLHSLLLPW